MTWFVSVGALLLLADVAILIWLHVTDARRCSCFNLNDYQELLFNTHACRRVCPIKNAYQAGQQAYEVWVDHYLAHDGQSLVYQPRHATTYYDPVNDCWLVQYQSHDDAPTRVPTIILRSNGEVLAAYDL